MEIRNLTCIVCPKGCRLKVEVDGEVCTVSGNGCKRGDVYGKNEVTNPVRTITSTVKIDNCGHCRLPVVTDQPVPKSMMFEVMKEINRIEVKGPVKNGDIILTNVLNTGANIIASRSVS